MYCSRGKKFKHIAANASHAYAPCAIQYATLEAVANFFQDPPDADTLIRRKRHQGLFLSMIKDIHDESDSESENDCKPMKNQSFGLEYHGLRFDLSSVNQWSEANRSRILLAALYLNDRFQLLVCHLRALRRANLTVSSRNLHELVSDLKHERMLKGATVEACLTLYFQIINAKRCLDAHLAEPNTSASFAPTHLYKIAECLVGYDDEIQKAKSVHMAAMDGSSLCTIRKPLWIEDADAKEGSVSTSSRANVQSSRSSPTQSPPSTPTSSQSSSPSAPSPRLAEHSTKSHQWMEQEMLSMHAQIVGLLATVKTQQSIIEALQGKVNSMEGELSKTKDDQEQLVKVTLRVMGEREE